LGRGSGAEALFRDLSEGTKTFIYAHRVKRLGDADPFRQVRDHRDQGISALPTLAGLAFSRLRVIATVVADRDGELLVREQPLELRDRRAVL
jgi:hypothetical protein